MSTELKQYNLAALGVVATAVTLMAGIARLRLGFHVVGGVWFVLAAVSFATVIVNLIGASRRTRGWWGTDDWAD